MSYPAVKPYEYNLTKTIPAGTIETIEIPLTKQVCEKSIEFTSTTTTSNITSIEIDGEYITPQNFIDFQATYGAMVRVSSKIVVVLDNSSAPADDTITISIKGVSRI